MVDEGFWGQVTSSVDWCENNYTWTLYIAEFWNSLSSFFIVFAGLFGLLFHYNHLEFRFKLIFFLVAVVGLGSVAFHASMLHWTQMMDEIPMIWGVCAILFGLVENEKTIKYGPGLPIALFLYAFLSSIWIAINYGSSQFFSFHTLFAIPELYCLWLIRKFYTGLEKGCFLQKFLSTGFNWYAFAGVSWFIDFLGCDYLNILPINPQFHSFGWHLFVSIGLYWMSIGMLFHRTSYVLKQETNIEYYFGIPVVSWKPKRS